MSLSRYVIFTGLVGATLAACSRPIHETGSVTPASVAAAATANPIKFDPRPTTAEITPVDLMSRLYVFADDSMMGRRSGHPGNDKGTPYLERQGRALDEHLGVPAGLEGPGQRAGQGLDLAVDDDGVHALLAAEVLVHDGLGHLGAGGDLLDARPLEPLLRDQLARHVEQLLAPLRPRHAGARGSVPGGGHASIMPVGPRPEGCLPTRHPSCGPSRRPVLRPPQPRPGTLGARRSALV